MPISRFYIVTVSGSGYRANVEDDGKPSLRKRQSGAEGGYDPSITGGAALLALSSSTISAAVACDEAPGYFVPGFSVAHTAGVVGLFQTEEEMAACLKSDSHIVLDPFWKKETLATLKALGHEHPAFKLPKSHTFVYEGDERTPAPKERWWAPVSRAIASALRFGGAR